MCKRSKLVARIRAACDLMLWPSATASLLLRDRRPAESGWRALLCGNFVVAFFLSYIK